MVGSAGHVVIGGGTGFIGTHLCKVLKAKKYDFTIISRMPGPRRMTWIDLKEKGLPDGTTAVVNLAGQNVLDYKRRWTEGFKQNVWNSRINTTCALAKAIVKAKNEPSSFVAISGVGIYEPHECREYTEESRGKEFDFLSKLCFEWENASRLPTTCTCRRVVLRTGVVLGRDGGMVKQLYWPYFLGLGGPVNPGSQFLPWIHISDLARLIIFAIDNKVTEVLNAVAPQPITNKEFSQAFGKALGRPAIFPVPEFIMNTIYNEERAKIVTSGQKVIPKRTQLLGFKYSFPDIDSACRSLFIIPAKSIADESVKVRP